MHLSILLLLYLFCVSMYVWVCVFVKYFQLKRRWKKERNNILSLPFSLIHTYPYSIGREGGILGKEETHIYSFKDGTGELYECI